MNQHWIFTRTAWCRSFLLLTPLLLALSLSACQSQASDESAQDSPIVSIAFAVERQVIAWDDFNGRIEAVQTVALRPRVRGHIETVHYQEGQTVKQGDVLFSIDARSYRAALSRAQAELASALAHASVARSEAARAHRLASRHAISTEELDQRRSVSAQADAAVQFAQAAVQTAKLELNFTQVRAPISGRTGRALVTVGNLVWPEGQENILTTLMSLDTVHVHFDSDERTYLRYSQRVRAGERADERKAGVPVKVGLVGEQGHPHLGYVDFIDNRVDSNTGTIRARATLSDADGLLTPGLYARVRLQGSTPFQAVLVDEKAVMTDQDRKYVYVVDEHNTARRRDISLGGVADGLRIVEKGLLKGDRVVVNGIQKVNYSGMPVQVQEVPMGSLHLDSQPVDGV